MDEFIKKYTRCCSDFLEFSWVSFEKTSTDFEENLSLILYYSIERRKDEDERLSEDIDGSNDYVAIERIPSHEAYQWVVAFVDEVVAPADEDAASRFIHSVTR